MLVVDLSGGDPEKQQSRFEGLFSFCQTNPKCLLVAFTDNDIYARQKLPGLFSKTILTTDALKEAIDYVKQNNGKLISASDSKKIGRESMHLSRIARIQPIIFGCYPKINGEFWFGDLGGSTENSTKQIIWVAYAGRCLGEVIFNRSPRIGLLNIGKEEGKGGDLEHYRNILSQIFTQDVFVGNVELTNISPENIDVLLSLGIHGNICLKASEATMELVANKVRHFSAKSLCHAFPALIYKSLARLMLDDLDWRNRSGGYVIGFHNPIIKVHGRADKIAFAHALELALDSKTNILWERLKYKENLDLLSNWFKLFVD